MGSRNMLRRFSLYGFLKNQQYYDPFMVLAWLQMGLSFTLIGILVAFREGLVNLLEIPSGAAADLWGRRRAMVTSFAGYIASFAVFGSAGVAATRGHLSQGALLPLLFVAMALFAVGDAFRTGTHKAMIFAWLQLQGRTDERTRVYGYTRSWSRIGSAVSVVLASGFVLVTRNYVYVFFFSIIPYLVNVVNLLGYPDELDGNRHSGATLGEVGAHLREAVTATLTRRSLRRLVFESMGFEGFFKASKDYLQPVLQAAALPVAAALFAGVSLSEEQSSVALIGPVYFALFLLSAVASRKAHRLVRRHGGEDRAARFLWLAASMTLMAMIPAMYFGAHTVVILGFVALYVLQNLWRPVLISRFGAHSDEAQGATILSIESQAKSVSTMVIAPLLGFAVDAARARAIGILPFWPVAVFGSIVATGFFLAGPPQGGTRKSGQGLAGERASTSPGGGQQGARGLDDRS